jgi:methylornithine synthase
MTLAGSTGAQSGRIGGGSLLQRILDKASREEALSRDEIIHLLGVRRPLEMGRVFAVARELRRRYFGDKIFLYGFIYFSTWCRNHCSFCSYRNGNRFCRRYRKTDREIFEASLGLANSRVHLLDLTMGEDPYYYDQEKGLYPLLSLVRRIKDETGLPIMISWGVVPPEILLRLPEAGADWYACYQETHSRQLFQKLRCFQDYDRRLQSKDEARRLGLLIEEGMLSGAGESLRDIADSLDFMRQSDFSQVRVMNFVPQEGTPMAQLPVPDGTRESQAIAVLRILMPRRLIPASLDVYGLKGLPEKLQAGANVVTSLISPESGLNGVASAQDISTGQRTVQAVAPVLRSLDLRTASQEDYFAWMKNEKMNSGLRMAV